MVNLREQSREEGSALLMGLVLLTLFSMLAYSVFDLTRDTVHSSKMFSNQYDSSLIAESILGRVKYEMYDKFRDYYEDGDDARTSEKMEWFTKPEEVNGADSEPGEVTLLGKNAEAEFQFKVPGVNNSVAQAFPNVPSEWADARYDVTMRWLDDTGLSAVYEIEVTAYFVDTAGDKIARTQRTIQDITEFGYGDSEAFNYLIYVKSDLHLGGDFHVFGDVKSDGDLTYYQNSKNKRPTMLGSAYSGGDVTYSKKSHYLEDKTTYEYGFEKGERSWKGNFFGLWNNKNYMNWTSDSGDGLNRLARPFKPDANISTTSTSRSDVEYDIVDNRWVGGGGGSSNNNNNSGSVADSQ